MTLKEAKAYFEESQLCERDKLYDILYRYFGIGDSDCYHLTRVKEAFELGTMHLDDFVEFNEDTIEDLVSYIMREWNKEEN